MSTTKTQKKKTQKQNKTNKYQYIYEKSKEIITLHQNKFKKLKDIFNNINFIYRLVDEKTNHKKLYQTISSYPSYLIWDETKKIIIDSLTKNKPEEPYIYKQYEYSFNNVIGAGTITFYSTMKYRNDIDKIIQKIIRIIGFYVIYTNNQLYLPDITIYYIDNNKTLPETETELESENRVIGKDVINSAFKNNNEIVIYRNEELFKLLTHELIHYYNIDSFIKEDHKVSNSLLNIYNITIEQKRKDLKVYEAYTEAIATILNIIFSTKSITVDNLYKEIVFSLKQNAKLFNYFGIKDSRYIYRKPALFKQTTAAFEYHYLKAKFLLNFNNLIELIRINTDNNDTNTVNLNLKIPKISTQDYIRLLGKDRDFDMVLNNILKTYSSGLDRNMRMTIT